MIKGVTHAHLGPKIGIILNFRHPLFPNPVSWVGLFFVASYSKIALIFKTELIDSKFVRETQLVKSMRFFFSNFE